MVTEPVVKLHELSVSIDGRSLIGQVSLCIVAGDRLCIVGPAGSGKSLLLELMAGRHVPHTGQLTYPAWVADHPDAALGVAPRFTVQLVSTNEQRRVCAQYASFHQARWHSSFTEPSTVREFLGPRQTYGLRAYEVVPEGLHFIDHDRRCLQIVTDLGIDYLLTRRLAALSNGEWRKLLLARALVARPRLLLLDDPLGGLDPEARSRIIDVLQRQCTQSEALALSSFAHHTAVEPGENMTLVLTSPRPEELSSLATSILELQAPSVSVPRKPTKKAPQTDATAMLVPTSVQPAKRVLRLRHATVRAGAVTLLDDVSLEVTRGEHWLITGPNGAGKSTLLAILLGDHPQSYVVDLEVLGLRAEPDVSRFDRQKRIGFMSPELAVHYPTQWSVREVVLSGLNATIGQYVEATDADGERAEYWLQRFGMDICKNRPLQSLSEVELRKAFLVRALVRKPALLILDEPTQGLAEPQRSELLDELDEVVRASHLTLIMVSHHALERPRCVTHHMALDQGRAVHCGLLASNA